MSQQLYKKVGKKYVQVGPLDGWMGFPSEGLWLVKESPGRKSEEWIKKISEIPDDTASYIKFKLRHDEISSSIINFFKEKEENAKRNKENGYSYSYHEMTSRILDDLYNHEQEKNKFKNKLLIEKIKKYKVKLR